MKTNITATKDDLGTTIALARNNSGYTQAEVIQKIQHVREGLGTTEMLRSQTAELLRQARLREGLSGADVISRGIATSNKSRCWYSKLERNERKIGAIELAEFAIALNVPIEDLFPEPIASQLIPSIGSKRGFKLEVKTRGFVQYLDRDGRRVITLYGKDDSKPERYLIGAKHYTIGADSINGEKQLLVGSEGGFYYASSPDIPGVAIAVPETKDIKRIFKLTVALHYEGLYKVGARRSSPGYSIEINLKGK